MVNVYSACVPVLKSRLFHGKNKFYFAYPKGCYWDYSKMSSDFTVSLDAIREDGVIDWRTTLQTSYVFSIKEAGDVLEALVCEKDHENLSFGSRIDVIDKKTGEVK